jgi:hypothetical protein
VTNSPVFTDRRKVGIFAVVLLAIGWGIQWWPDAADSYDVLSGACVRVGAVLAVLWLALPETGRPQNRWVLVGLAIMAAVVVFRPRLILLALVVIVAIAVLRPRIGSKAPPPS